MRNIALIILFFLIIRPFSSAEPVDNGRLLEGIKHAYETYDNGYNKQKDKNAIADSLAILEALRIEYPSNALLKMLCARLIIREGMDSFWVWEKYIRTRRGIRMAEEAFRSAPDNVYVKVEYAKLCYFLPSFFGKRQKSLLLYREIAEELKRSVPGYLITEWEEWQAFNSKLFQTDSPSVTELRIGFIQMSYFYLAKIYERAGDYTEAKKNMTLSYSLDKSSSYGSYAYLWLYYKKY